MPPHLLSHDRAKQVSVMAGHKQFINARHDFEYIDDSVHSILVYISLTESQSLSILVTRSHGMFGARERRKAAAAPQTSADLSGS